MRRGGGEVMGAFSGGLALNLKTLGFRVQGVVRVEG